MEGSPYTLDFQFPVTWTPLLLKGFLQTRDIRRKTQRAKQPCKVLDKMRRFWWKIGQDTSGQCFPSDCEALPFYFQHRRERENQLRRGKHVKPRLFSDINFVISSFFLQLCAFPRKWTTRSKKKVQKYKVVKHKECLQGLHNDCYS